MDLLKAGCCPKCTKLSSFQHVIDNTSLGISILRYAEGVMHQMTPVEDDAQLQKNIGPTGDANIFVIVNNNKQNVPAFDINTEFDINKVKCPRCRYRAEKALTWLPNQISLKKGDIRGICDHCKKEQLSEKLCLVCEAIVKKFMDMASEVHLRKTSDSALHLKPIKCKTNLYKPILTVLPPKHLKVTRKANETVAISNLLSDESVVTSFITTYSKDEKTQQDESFKYVFPETKEVETKAVEVTSSILRLSTLEKQRQQSDKQQGEKLGTLRKTKFEETISDKEVEKISKSEAIKDSQMDQPLAKKSIPLISTDSLVKKKELNKRSEEEMAKRSPKKDGRKIRKSNVYLSKEEKVKQEKNKVKEEQTSSKDQKEFPEMPVQKSEKKIDSLKTTSEVQEEKTKEKESKEAKTGKKQMEHKGLNTVKKEKETKTERTEKEHKEPKTIRKDKEDIETKTGKKDIEAKETKTARMDKEAVTGKNDKENKETIIGRKGKDDITGKKDKENKETKTARKEKKHDEPTITRKEKDDKEPKARQKEKQNKGEQIKKEKESKGVQIKKEKEIKETVKNVKEDKQKKLEDIEAKKRTPREDKEAESIKRQKEKNVLETKMLERLTNEPQKSITAVKGKDSEIKKQEPVGKKEVKKKTIQHKSKDKTKEPLPQDKKGETKITKELTRKREYPKIGVPSSKTTQTPTQDDKSNEKKKSLEETNKIKKEENIQSKYQEKQVEMDAIEVVPAEPDHQILKLLPIQKKESNISKRNLTPNELMKIAEERMAQIQHILLETARHEFMKHESLPTLPAGEYFLFKLQVKGPPVLQERKKRTFKDLQRQVQPFALKKMRMKGPSYDNLILKLAKIGQQKQKQQSRKIQHRPGKYKIASARRRHNSLMSLSIDSDFELEFESFTQLVTVKDIIFKDKIENVSIVKNKPTQEKKEVQTQPEPLLFQKDYGNLKVDDINEIEEEPQIIDDPRLLKGVFRYSLSDHTFIDKGVTMLPTLKVLRKMNIYKIRPAQPEFDWFNNNKHKGFMTYDTGEKLAEFDENGRGRWYYKNGRIAIDYYDSEDMHAQQRFVIYSSGEQDENCRSMPVTVLAIFDYLGNGVVFDHHGKIRVKYNQTEGVLLDKGIGPTSRWKWHSLNDPPVLKQVMIDTNLEHPYPEIMQLGDPNDDEARKEDEDMLAIEIDNYVKEKTQTTKRKFHPYQIKTKSLKINKQMSLRILDQAHVYLYFHDGLTNIKLNLGVVLDQNEIIDTRTADVDEVSTCIEQYPPKTDSILDLQEKLTEIRRCERQRMIHDRKNHLEFPVSSTDRLLRFVSKPLRRPLSVMYPEDENVGICCRKPSKINLYYNTTIV